MKIQSPHFLITVFMMLKTITERLALEITMAFLTFGYTLDEGSLIMATNTFKWKDIKTKVTKMTELPQDMGVEMMLPVLMVGLLMKSPNMAQAKRMMITLAMGSLSLIPQVMAGMVGTAHLSNYKHEFR